MACSKVCGGAEHNGQEVSASRLSHEGYISKKLPCVRYGAVRVLTHWTFNLDPLHPVRPDLRLLCPVLPEFCLLRPVRPELRLLRPVCPELPGNARSNSMRPEFPRNVGSHPMPPRSHCELLCVRMGGCLTAASSIPRGARLFKFLRSAHGCSLLSPLHCVGWHRQ